MTDRFFTENVWQSVAEVLVKGERKLAAIAYVTNDVFLPFNHGDVLLCDASNQAIASGETSAALLSTLHSRGVELYSAPGLHAKVLVTDSLAVVGSSNLSRSSAVNLIEAALVTSKFEQRSQVRAFIQKLCVNATEIDAAFISRIRKIPVVRRARHGIAKSRPSQKSRACTWIVSTCPLSDKLADAETEFSDAGIAVAESRIVDLEAGVSWIRWAGNSLFRKDAKEGDTVIELECNRARTRCRVIEPRPIIYRQDGERWTRFYLADIPKMRHFSWTAFRAEMTANNIRTIDQRSTRTLTSHECEFMNRLWNCTG